ncbi:MAG: CDP-diacylglycerol--glycerol-3-phosphate 3-phosphatidyltransferase [Clostridia bacterium]|nr:CDP-diacylglycerol--glycerol-3-phosphate 3-phosphatidyltransferase [Clostridia bacterium]
MNIANKLTLLRLVLVPFFVVFGLIGGNIYGYIALGIFVFASFTDYLDGYLARKYNLVSDFGKFMDPLADKLLVMSALALLVHRGDTSVWIFYVVVIRELVVTGIRLIASSNGRVIQAAMTGKIKTVIQMIIIILALIPYINDNFLMVTTDVGTVLDILMYIMLAVTIISGTEYVVKNADVIKP